MENRKITLNVIKHESKKAEWAQKIKECRNSGKKIKDWCRENGVNEKTYYRWQRLIWDEEIRGREIEPVTGKEIQFVEIPNIQQPSETKTAGIIVQNGNWRIELQKDADAEMVSKIIGTVARYV